MSVYFAIIKIDERLSGFYKTELKMKKLLGSAVY